MTTAPTKPGRPVVEMSVKRREGAVTIRPAVSNPLQGRHIMLDTYNLRLRKGSGIKTYGLTLFEALQMAEANVSLLGDRPVPKSRHKVLEEVLFYDHPKRRGRLRRMLKSVSTGARSVVATSKPVEIGQDFVVPDEWMRQLDGTAHVFNAGQVYDAANATFKQVGRTTTVKSPRRMDVWHATTLLPIRVKGAKMVTTVHDVIPLRLPYTTLDDKKFFYLMLRETLKVSDLIFSVSECTKQDILRFFPEVPENKIVVTFQATPFRVHQRNEHLERAVLARHNLARGEYLLFVGNIEPKKNVRTLIEAVEGMGLDLPLVIVGRKAWLWEEQLEHITNLPEKEVRARFRLLNYVPRSDLSALYANAMCLVFPSLYEGFGLPPLEAMAHGCPVICSNVSSLPEVCGDAAHYVDPYDVDSIRAQIATLADDARERERMMKAGYSRLEFFSPARYAERLKEAYGKILAST